jgi:hypothetical protein
MIPHRWNDDPRDWTSTVEGYVNYHHAHAHQVVILCPWCGDWEDVTDVVDQLATGRFWCCEACDLHPHRSWPRCPTG